MLNTIGGIRISRNVFGGRARPNINPFLRRRPRRNLRRGNPLQIRNDPHGRLRPQDFDENNPNDRFEMDVDSDDIVNANGWHTGVVRARPEDVNSGRARADLWMPWRRVTGTIPGYEHVGPVEFTEYRPPQWVVDNHGFQQRYCEQNHYTYGVYDENAVEPGLTVIIDLDDLPTAPPSPTSSPGSPAANSPIVLHPLLDPNYFPPSPSQRSLPSDYYDSSDTSAPPSPPTRRRRF